LRTAALGAVSVLYRFKGGTDGKTLWGPVLATHAAIYGTTETGGVNNSQCGSFGCGTVFRLAR
jgi:hypothetical protein